MSTPPASKRRPKSESSQPAFAQAEKDLAESRSLLDATVADAARMSGDLESVTKRSGAAQPAADSKPIAPREHARAEAQAALDAAHAELGGERERGERLAASLAEVQAQADILLADLAEAETQAEVHRTDLADAHAQTEAIRRDLADAHGQADVAPPRAHRRARPDRGPALGARRRARPDRHAARRIRARDRTGQCGRPRSRRRHRSARQRRCRPHRSRGRAQATDGGRGHMPKPSSPTFARWSTPRWRKPLALACSSTPTLPRRARWPPT